MQYENMEKGIFLDRPNRFIANVEIRGVKEVCHVKNTGRCRELLTPRATVYVQKSNNPDRKTKYDLIGVIKGDIMINMDSQAPNKVVGEWIQESGYFKNVTYIKPEMKYGNSRFDFYVEADGKKIFMEVKGVTLEEDGIARFPDAPTLRGVKHIQELKECINEGYEAYIFFVIQMKHVQEFRPNDLTHPEFGDALRQARQAGVHILAYDSSVTEDSIKIDTEIKVIL